MVGIAEIGNLVDIVPDMVCIADKDGYPKYLNNAWKEVLDNGGDNDV